MLINVLMGLSAVLSVTAIRVPINKEVENINTASLTANEQLLEPNFYAQRDDKTYLIPREPEKHAEIIVDVIPKPATYLLPPLTDKQSDYHYQETATGQQSDWYPIVKISQNTPSVLPIILPEVNETEALNIIKNTRNGKALYDQSSVPTPSTKLEPPASDAPNDYLSVAPSDEPELLNYPIHRFNGLENSDHHRLTFNGDQNRYMPHFQSLYKQKLILPQMLPYKSVLAKLKTPTRFYPKKYSDGYKPIAIPISQYADDTTDDEVPRARPLKPFHPMITINDEYPTTPEEKKVFLFEEAEKKRKQKIENLADKQQYDDQDAVNENDKPTNEQQTSESHLRHPERSAYESASQETPRLGEFKNKEHAPPPTGERTEFRMHGMKGPHSYQFGYDTGKGKNRQFRYEERDNDGHVRGHYGYMDRNGKLRVVNYDADPEHGFRAEAPVEKEE